MQIKPLVGALAAAIIAPVCVCFAFYWSLIGTTALFQLGGIDGQAAGAFAFVANIGSYFLTISAVMEAIKDTR